MNFDFYSFPRIFWIDASSTSTITQGLKGICNLPGAQSCALDGSLESALFWIGALRDNYVIVFDNADILSPEELEHYFPPGLNGNILLTSRNSAMQCLTSPANCLEVKELAQSDAIMLLLKASCLDIAHSDDLYEKASVIVKELFCFPLAIDQAGAMIRSGAINITDYLGIYSQQRKTLLSHPEFKGASRYNRTVYGTWELLYKEIQQRTQSDNLHTARAAKSAILILGIFSFFHHDGLSEDIFSNAAVESSQTRRGRKRWLGFLPKKSILPLASSKLDYRLLPLNDAGLWNNLIFKEGVQLLLSFCFIRLGAQDSKYAVHPLIHAWYRDRMTSKERKQFCLMAYVMLACSLHKDFHRQPYSFRRALVTHIKANVQHSRIFEQDVVDSYFDDASVKFVWILREQGYPKEAEIIAIKVVDVRRKILGKNHQSTIWAVECLSEIYRDLGKYAEAEKLQQQCLDSRIRLFGEENLHTIKAMAGLGLTYNKMGKYREAKELETKVLHARIKILGTEDPNTIASMGYLARTYNSLGMYAEAEKLLKQCLDTRIRLFGEEDPCTITAMACLGESCHKLGKYREAEELETKALNARIKILGREHPHTITSMGYLAETYDSLGKYAEAEKLQKQCLDARTMLLGEGHPKTLMTMECMALTYKHINKYEEAEKLEIQVLNGRTRIFGETHAFTILAMKNLAMTYRYLGKDATAKTLQVHVQEADKGM